MLDKQLNIIQLKADRFEYFQHPTTYNSCKMLDECDCPRVCSCFRVARLLTTQLLDLAESILRLGQLIILSSPANTSVVSI